MLDRDAPPGRLETVPVIAPPSHRSGRHPRCDGLLGLLGRRRRLRLGLVLGVLRHGGLSTPVSAVAEGIAVSGGLLHRGVAGVSEAMRLFFAEGD